MANVKLSQIAVGGTLLTGTQFVAVSSGPTDNLYTIDQIKTFVGSTPPAGSATQLQFNAGGGVFGAVSGSAVDTNGSLTLGGATVAVSDPVIKMTQTWNGTTIATTSASGTGATATIGFAAQAAAFPVGSSVTVAGVTPTGYNGTFVVTASTTTSVSYANATTGAQTVAGTVQQLFTALRVNATNTASASGSFLLDLQVGGNSVANFNSLGGVTLTRNSGPVITFVDGTLGSFATFGTDGFGDFNIIPTNHNGNVNVQGVSGSGVNVGCLLPTLSQQAVFGLDASNNPFVALGPGTSGTDTFLGRSAANIWQMGSSATTFNGSLKLATVFAGNNTVTSSAIPAVNISQTWNSPAIATTAASGTGTVATISFAAQPYAPPVGSWVYVTGVTPSGYNTNGSGSPEQITASTTTSVSYASTATGAQTVAGTISFSQVPIFVNITDTTSSGFSDFADFLVGGVSQFRVDKFGELIWQAANASISQGSTFIFGDAAIINFNGIKVRDVTIQGNGAITANAPAINASQTWNNAAVKFDGFKLNVTNTASAVGSNLLDLQIGGTTVFAVDDGQDGLTAPSARMFLNIPSDPNFEGVGNPSQAVIATDGNVTWGLALLGYNNNNFAAGQTQAKTRATTPLGAGVALVEGDQVGAYYFLGDDGTGTSGNMPNAARMFVNVDGAVGTNIMPGRWSWNTSDHGSSDARFQERMRLDANGYLTFNGGLGQIGGYNDLLSFAATCTITIASPAVITLNNHGFVPQQQVQFSTTGALPTGITAGVTYYVSKSGLTQNTFEIDTLPNSSAGFGGPVNTSGTQSGTQTCTAVIISNHPSPTGHWGNAGLTQLSVDNALRVMQLWNQNTFATTATSGTGTTATITFTPAVTSAAAVGSTIVVSGVTPTTYNGTYAITASTTTTVSYASTATGAQVAAGTVQIVSTTALINPTSIVSNPASAALDVQVNSVSALRVANNLVTFGGLDSPSPVPSLVTFPNVATGTFNTAAPNTTISGGASTGIGNPGSSLFQIATTFCNVDAGRTLTSISNASPAVLTTAANHNLFAFQSILLSTTGTLPSPFATFTTYFVDRSSLGSTTFELSSSYGGAVINTTTAGSGTHSYNPGAVCTFGSTTANTPAINGVMPGMAVRFVTTGTLPTPLALNTTYYATGGFTSGTGFTFSLTPNGSNVGGISGGSGTHAFIIQGGNTQNLPQTLFQFGPSLVGPGDFTAALQMQQFTNSVTGGSGLLVVQVTDYRSPFQDTYLQSWQTLNSGNFRFNTLAKANGASVRQELGFGSNQFIDWVAGGQMTISTASGASIAFANSANTDFLTVPANAVWQLGKADAASPVAQTLQVQSVVSGTTNTAGVNWTNQGSLSTGTGTSGNILFNTGFVGVTGAATFTVTIASPAVFTLNSHGYPVGQVLQFTTTGALPTGLSLATNYYVIAAGLTQNNFEVSATPGGAAVNTSGSQSGTHTSTPQTNVQNSAANVLTIGTPSLGGSQNTFALQATQTTNSTANNQKSFIFNTITTAAVGSNPVALSVQSNSLPIFEVASTAVGVFNVFDSNANIFIQSFASSGISQLSLNNRTNIGFNPNTSITNPNDIAFMRDAGAGALRVFNPNSLSSGVTLHVYNTIDVSNGSGPTNFERGIFDWQATTNVLTIGTQKGGTGSTRTAQWVIGGNITDNIGTAPITDTAATYSVLATDKYLIFNGSGSITVTLPAASTSTGRELWLKTIAAQTVVSASSNVVPRAGGAAGTAILAGAAGNWATMVSDGSNWILMAGTP